MDNHRPKNNYFSHEKYGSKNTKYKYRRLACRNMRCRSSRILGSVVLVVSFFFLPVILIFECYIHNTSDDPNPSNQRESILCNDTNSFGTFAMMPFDTLQRKQFLVAVVILS